MDNLHLKKKLHSKAEDDPLISVIVPVYNVERYLPECLDSILAQTYENLEILLVDDGSADSSGRICDEYGRRDSRIRVFHRENRGVAASRNLGMDEARGEIFVFADSDDWVSENLCRTVAENMRDPKTDILCFSWNYEGGEEREKKRAPRYPDEVISGKEALGRILTERISIVIWGMAYRRRVAENIRIPVGFFSEDLGVTYRFVEAAQKVRLIPDILYFYRRDRSESITRVRPRKLYVDGLYFALRRFYHMKFRCPEYMGRSVKAVCNWYANSYKSLGFSHNKRFRRFFTRFFKKYKTSIMADEGLGWHYKLWIRINLISPGVSVWMFSCYNFLKKRFGR